MESKPPNAGKVGVSVATDICVGGRPGTDDAFLGALGGVGRCRVCWWERFSRRLGRQVGGKGASWRAKASPRRQSRQRSVEAGTRNPAVCAICFAAQGIGDVRAGLAAENALS
ncbi:hypothetical protein CEP53_013505 [Fusarium sp. AF-6]|nr:hypothetical protein CEP53_013505 [Fusarium sp. AF-6]